MSPSSDIPTDGERIAKVLARAGVCSRREAERLIEDGRIAVDGEVLTSPAVKVTRRMIITVDGRPLPEPEPMRLWRYHKPPGLVTTHFDPDGRPTVFERLPEELPRVVSVGRLDLNSEGLLLLTNDGGLARHLELPATGWVRRYRVRAFGRAPDEDFERLTKGVVIDGEAMRAEQISVDSERGANLWLTMSVREGKNREIRRLLEHIGLKVTRLIRISYGPFQLGELERGEVEEVRAPVLEEQLGRETYLALKAGDVPKPKAPRKR